MIFSRKNERGAIKVTERGEEENKRRRGHTGLLHELIGKTEPPVGSEDGEGGDVPMRISGFLILHLGQDVANNLAILINGNIGDLGPGERVVQVVLELVVLRQTEQIAVLNIQQVPNLFFFFFFSQKREVSEEERSKGIP